MSGLKDKVASGLGSVLEWYDFSLYGFFAPLIAQLYFPSAIPIIGLLKAFSVSAIGFFARPLGAFIFGHISDRYGRKISLKLTPLLITFPTLLLAILPTYHQIGYFAPLILIFLRVFQGICIGGEYGSSLVYLCETVRQKHIYFWGSIGSCTASFGILLASTVVAVWNQIFNFATLLSWGWRMAFAISLLLWLITYVMRRNMLETPVFKNIYDNNQVTANPIVDSCRSQWMEYLIAFGLIFLPATSFYYIFLFLPTYLNVVLHMNTTSALNNNSLSLLGRLFIIPVLGIVADKIGGLTISRIAAVLFLFFTVPLLSRIFNHPNTAIISLYCLVAFTTLNAATTPGLMIELLKPETRCTMVSITFNLCFGVLGGIVPIVGFLLSHKIGNPIAFSYYLVFAAMITLMSTFFFKKRCLYGYKELPSYPHSYH